MDAVYKIIVDGKLHARVTRGIDEETLRALLAEDDIIEVDLIKRVRLSTTKEEFESWH